ncbi:hypothetical protein [Paraburkholderia phenazinium]|jgi:hypothetical protein|uniref:Uncharacterized protein n=1 Tax=Paraburkholderia phenazinium TaxID=60549 RepID=A0A1N6EBT6_9BURK|nr:hypothetical protein [Paraburkholderia phenazinium]SIN80505.1 hypothetical protein SAMN05444168_0427 [Paraburkholderia phenazinium]
MTYFTDEQVAARELRDAAHHEAGHKMLHEYFGGAGDAVLRKNESGNPDERAWLGDFRPRMCPEAKRKATLANGIAVPELPGNWKILVGMAGLLAEEILNGETDDVSAMADNMFFRISFGEASDSDLAQIGVTDIDNCELSYEVIEEAVQLLLPRVGARPGGGRVSN